MKLKTAIICGSTGKLGQFISRNLLNDDYHVVALNKSKNILKDNNYFEYICDFNNLKKLEITVNKIKKRFKNIKLLINTVAIEGDTINNKNFDIRSWKKSFNVNFLSSVVITKCMLKNLNKKKLSVIFFSGGGATTQPEGLTARLLEYSCSKIALIRFTDILGTKLYSNSRVNFNILSPGLLPGNIIRNILKKYSKYISFKEKKLFTKLKKPYLFFDQYLKIYKIICFLEKNKKVTGKIISTNYDNISLKNKKLYDKNKYKLRRLL